ncbi:tetratricopeptide repeat protein [Vibrio alfacsensis]|jgi:MSHA biogenesis protein MshN|uniref:tetratricopeptide repeat protein n=1 Tax=Vibrio TaxID=662 RepID=UPI004068E2D5
MESALSAINKALSELAEKESPSALIKAEVPCVSKNKPWLWLVGGFSLSLAVGGWAVSQEPTFAEQDRVSVPTLAVRAPESVNVPVTTLTKVSESPTSKATPKLDNVIYTKRVESPQPEVKVEDVHQKLLADKALHDTEPRQVPPPVLLAKVIPVPSAPSASTPSSSVPASSMRIEQVELTPQQLAEKALVRADKAMDANDMKSALAAFNEALRYQPTNVEARQKLAALYFGKGDTREAYDILQAGINLDRNNQVLRLALSKLLVKAEQLEAALSPLVHMPPAPSRDYLAMRAALAQKQKQNEIALESYQLLTSREPENARWWLGLAIQQERALAFQSAIDSYQQALGKVGISNQSQAFIRDRLNLLKQLESAQ